MKLQLTTPIYVDRCHMAPCAEIVQRVLNLDCEVWFTWNNKKVNCKSITNLFLANLHFGDKITIYFTGNDAEVAKHRLEKYFTQQQELFK